MQFRFPGCIKPHLSQPYAIQEQLLARHRLLSIIDFTQLAADT